MFGADIDWGDKFTLVAAIVTAILGSGRLTRVLTADDFPPAAWVRATWLNLTRDRRTNDDGPWGKLVTCWWCAAPWITAFCFAWAWMSSLHWTWWAFWGVLGASYVASMVVERDDRPDAE